MRQLFIPSSYPNLQNYLQIDQYKRPEVADVIKILDSTAALISNDPQIESDWRSFHSLIKIPAEFMVQEMTQCSRDLFKEVSQLTFIAKSGQMLTEGTKLHDQKDTNLCAYFATMSALRHQLRKTAGSEISEGPLEGYVDGELEIDKYLKRRDQDDKRFQRDLAVMIGCVCPRALSGRLKIFFILS